MDSTNIMYCQQVRPDYIAKSGLNYYQTSAHFRDTGVNFQRSSKLELKKIFNWTTFEGKTFRGRQVRVRLSDIFTL